MLPVVEVDEELKAYVKEFASTKIDAIARGAMEKLDRKESFKVIREELMVDLEATKGEEYFSEKAGEASKIYDKLKKEVIREMVMADGVRLDGRALDEIRPIWTEIDYLPSTHGSAIFTRGETQALRR